MKRLVLSLGAVLAALVSVFNCPLQTGGDMLVMRKGSTITNWATLVAAAKAPGKPIQIGYKAAIAVAKTIFEGALKAEGISYGYDATKSDVRVILVNFSSEASPVPLLEIGALDGFVMNQPAAALAAHKGAGQVVAELAELPPIGKWRDHPCCVVVATESTLKSQSQAQNGVILDYLPKMAKNVFNILLSDQIGMIINGSAT